MAVLLRSDSRGTSGGRESMSASRAGPNVYLSPLLWLMAALMLVYVGVELGIASWISTYMGITTGMLAQYGAWATSVYWAALAVGRLAGAAASRIIGRMSLLGIALGGSLLGGVGLFLSHELVLPTILCPGLDRVLLCHGVSDHRCAGGI